MRRCTLFYLPLLATTWLIASAGAQDLFKTYDTRYYVLRTDLSAKGVQEISRHVTKMAEEFHQRTRGFAGAVQERLPIHVFQHAEDYYAAGGMPGTAGVFNGTRLMLVAGEELSARSWHVIQHEAFHQFALAAIGRQLPPWANEGLAEYFGHGVYTGDNFYTGLIPTTRLAQVKKAIEDDQFKPLRQMMRLRQDVWNAEINLAHASAGLNYLQAWSMIHFLAHADHGHYQDAFAIFLRGVSHGQSWEQAWSRAFGNSVEAFQQRWEEYWLNLPEDPTEELRAEIVVSILTSHFARAFSQRQLFDNMDEFLAAAEAGELKSHPEDWLAPRLLEAAIKNIPEVGTWSIQRRPGKRLVVCERPDGTRLEGQFRIRNHRVQSVEVYTRAPQKKRK
ncbi:MAG: DUF1570 domain-containing protein [Planctomycetota bacterium]